MGLEKFAWTILNTIYFGGNNLYKVPSLLPLPIPYTAFSFERSRLLYITKKGAIKSPFPAPNPKPRVLFHDLWNVAKDIGKGLLFFRSYCFRSGCYCWNSKFCWYTSRSWNNCNVFSINHPNSCLINNLNFYHKIQHNSFSII